MTRTPDLLDLLGDRLPTPPEGMVLGWRSIRPDLRSRDGFRWPWPGGWAEAPDEACPSGELGGLCLAKTWSGARSGGARSRGVPAHIGLVVAYHPDDVLGEDAHKLRVRRCLVLDVVDVCAHIRAGHCTGANLTRADLTGANLGGAYLGGANLGGADLDGANLTRANLTGADLTRVNLTGAYLTRADLTGADLGGANLGGADLGGANLTRADLTGAYLDGAYLDGAYRSLGDPPIPGWEVRDDRLVEA